MIIPRERKLVRFYVELDTVAGPVGRNLTADDIVETAQRIISPYTLRHGSCEWHTTYRIGQRIAEKYSLYSRIFLAGDAVHTNSPKAGLGMNVSMQDSFNLGWKLGLVIKGIMRPSILDSYEAERRSVAVSLVTYDESFSRRFVTLQKSDASQESDSEYAEGFRRALDEGHEDTSGLTVSYSVSGSINGGVPKRSSQEDGESLVLRVGSRMPDCQVVKQSDGRPHGLLDLLACDGRFRLIVFGGQVSEMNQLDRLRQFAESLQECLQRLQSRSAIPMISILSVLLVHSSPRHDIEFFDLPEIFRPFSEQEGWAYDKIFADDYSYRSGHGEAYTRLGIGRESGHLALVRPDHHVEVLVDLDQLPTVEDYFQSRLMTKSDRKAALPN